MKIGELARRTGCQPVTIRYYEQAGLLPQPPRSESNYRVYTKAHEERLLFIRNCRALDMSLDEVRQLLDYRDDPVRDCSEVNELIDEHIGHVTRRIQALQALESQLTALRRRCAEAREMADCPILQELTVGEQHAALGRASHIGHSHD